MHNKIEKQVKGKLSFFIRSRLANNVSSAIRNNLSPSASYRIWTELEHPNMDIVYFTGEAVFSELDIFFYQK